jgi:hypothetical protein
MHQMERRRNARLEINLRCRLTSLRLGGQPFEGVTENMSRGEVMVRLATEQGLQSLPLIGEPVIVEIDLPANHAFGRKCMQCQTTVLRVSSSETGGTNLTMRIHKMRFQSVEEPSAAAGSHDETTRHLLM